MEKIKQNELDKIMSAICAYLDPNMLIPDLKNSINIKNVDNKKLDKYIELLSSIDYFFKKILKYKIYFVEFYPDSKEITKAEALEYHIYAYLQYMVILKNKITTFLGVLKNDIKKIALNKEEINDVLKEIIEKVEHTFDEVKKHRNPHHHGGYRLLNSDLIDSNMFNIMLKDDFPLKERVNVDNVKQKEKESFEKAKNDYIEISEINNKNITRLIDAIFRMNNRLICEVLNIQLIDSIINKQGIVVKN